MAAPRLELNPGLNRRVKECGKTKNRLALAAGFSRFSTFYDTLRSEYVDATPLTVTRLQRVADLVGFPRGEIFLDREGSV
jgi:hypothetical protein